VRLRTDTDRMSKSVSFGAPPPAYSVTDPVPNQAQSSPSLREVSDLCASIKLLQASRIGFSLNSQRNLCGAYAIDTTETHVPSSEILSLEDLLAHPYVTRMGPFCFSGPCCLDTLWLC
jgi:hypothetical protein